MAWLAGATNPAFDDEADPTATHKAWRPSFEERAEGRATLSALPESDRWLELERPPFADEADEPEVVP